MSGESWAEVYGALKIDEQRWRASTTQYGTGIHYPTCNASLCTGCLPELRDQCRVVLSVPQVIDGEIVGEPARVPEGLALGVTDEQRSDPMKVMRDRLPVWRA